MRKTLCITLLLTSTTALAADFVVKSPTLPIFSDITPQSQQAWQGIPNRIDPHWLDHFIATFPEANETPVAFTLRYNLVQGARSIPAYHAFIDQYRYTLAAHQAQHELLQLYQERHEFAGYLTFMYRYPDTSLALVAKALAEQVAFEQVAKTDKISEYDAFIQVFPTAPQVPAAEQQALKKAIAEETAYLNTQLLGRLFQRLHFIQQRLTALESLPNAQTDAHIQRQIRALEGVLRNLQGSRGEITLAKEQRARERCRDLEQQARILEKQAESLSEAQQQEWRQALRQFKRLAQVIRTVYAQQEATRCVREEERFQRLIQKFEQLIDTIKTENDRLIAVIRAEFAETRNLLTTEFERLHQDNQIAQARLKQLLKGLDQLHEDLQLVNHTLRQIHQEVVEVRLTIEQSHQHLALLHQDLNTVQHHLVQLNKDMNQGLTAQQQLLTTVVKELHGGFNTLHHDLQAAMSQEQRLHEDIKQVELKILEATDDTTKTILRTHQERLIAEAQHTRTLIKQMQTSTQAIVHSQEQITGAIHQQTETSVYNTERLLDSNRATRDLIQKQGQQMRKVAQSSGESGGGGFLGTVVSVVSSFF
jgi:hypothetical protein